MKDFFADKKRRTDLLVIGLFLLLALVLYLVIGATREEGGVVVVRVDGVETERHALSESGTYPLNGGSNILVIDGGQASGSSLRTPGKDPLYRAEHHLSSEPSDRDGRGRRG